MLSERAQEARDSRKHMTQERNNKGRRWHEGRMGGEVRKKEDLF